MAFELEKERILRKNLEKSYKNLLKELEEREQVLDFEDSEQKVLKKREKKRRVNLFSDRKIECEAINEHEVRNEEKGEK